MEIEVVITLMRNGDYGTVLGFIKLVSFDEFVNLIKTKRVSDKADTVRFNVQVKEPFNINNTFPSSTEESDFIVCEAPLMSDENALKKSLLFQVSMNKTDLADGVDGLFEDLIVENEMNFGNPKYLVRVSRRMWMAADPGDFMVFKNENKDTCVLACTNRLRTVLYSVDK